MQPTGFKLPTSIISNSPGVNSWTTPTNIFLVDDKFAISSGSTNIMTVGNFNHNLPVGATVSNIIVAVKGYRGSFNTTLQIFAVDDTSGVTLSYPMLPTFQGFDGVNTLWTLPGTLFGTTWNTNQLNNIKFQFIADGELWLDTVEVNVEYTPVTPPVSSVTLNYTNLVGGLFAVGNTVIGSISGASAVIVSDDGVSEMTFASVTNGPFQVGETISNGSGVTATVANPVGLFICDEFVQAQPFQLAQAISSSSTTALLQSFNYPDGTQIQITDFYGDAMLTIEQGVPGKEENVRIVGVAHNYNGTGFVQLNFGTIANRGLGYEYPYTTVPALRQDHSGTSELVISNSAPFYSRFVKKCQADAVFSVPITVKDEGSTLTTSLHVLDFVGDGATAVLTTLHKVTATITDHFVKATATDTTHDYLDPKIELVSDNLTVTIAKTILNPGANEKISYNLRMTGGGGGGGHIIADNLVPLPTEPVLNFVNYFTLTDTPGISTNVSINGTELGNDLNLISSLTANSTFISNIFTITGGPVFTDQTPLGTGSSYGTITGAINGVNTTYVVSQAKYGSGRLLVFLNGQELTQGSTEDWVETNPLTGTFDFNTPIPQFASPGIPNVITASYQTFAPTGGIGNQTGIQFEDQTGAPLGTSGTVNEFEITGTPVTAARVGNKVTYTISGTGGGGGGVSQIDQSPLGAGSNYGAITGAINGINTTFTVSAGVYLPGKLQVYRQGLFQLEGTLSEIVETTPGSGIFDFVTAPPTGNKITAVYSSTTGGSGTDLSTTVNQTTHGLSVGDVIKSNGVANQFAKAQANSPINSEAVGIVTVVTDANNFTYTSSAIQLTGGFVPAGTPGDGVFLSPTVAGGMTTTKPTTVGQIVRGLGTILASGSKMYFDIAALAEEITAAGVSNANGFVQQDIPYALGGGNTPVLLTSNLDGTLLFLAYLNSTTTTIQRISKDSITGNYYITHTTTLTVDSGSLRGIAVAGNYVYVGAIISGNTSIERYDIADLANVVNMTGVSAGTIDGVMWSDGVDLFTYNGTDTFDRYTISGTTVTDVGSITFTGSGSAVLGAISDGNFAYLSGSTGNGAYYVRKYAITGGSPTSTTSIFLYSNAYVNDNEPNLFIGGNSILGIGWGFQYVASGGNGMKLIGITLP